MFVILLKLSENKSKASEFMDGHNEWIKQGFEDGVFFLVGSLQPNRWFSFCTQYLIIRAARESK